MSWLKAAVRVVKKTAAVATPEKPKRHTAGDPWLLDDERRRRVNEASPRNARRWIPRRPGWLSKILAAIASLVRPRPRRPARPIRRELGLEPGGMFVRDLTIAEVLEGDRRLVERHQSRPRWLDGPGR